MKKALLVLFAILCVFLSLRVNTFATPVPDTGLTKCFGPAPNPPPCPNPGETYYGMDANYSINPQSYTMLDESGKDLPDAASSWAMVRDNVTGLIWINKTPADGFTDYTNPLDSDNVYVWYKSEDTSQGNSREVGLLDQDFLTVLNSNKYGGFSDWRLPTVKELFYMQTRDYVNPSFNLNYFAGGMRGGWSSTAYIGTEYCTGEGQKCVWGVVGNGYAAPSREDIPSQAVAVHGAKDSQSFIDNGDGTVTDTSTGLMWQKDGTTRKNWKNALAYCEDLNFAGHDDWRMPNINELFSIVDFTKEKPAIDTTYFPDTAYPPQPGEYNKDYLSSTALLGTCVVDFGSGSAGMGVETSDADAFYVRAVRGGAAAATTTTTIPEDTTTTTIPATTTTVPGGGVCPAKTVMGQSNPALNKLRAFRNQLFAKTAAGKYYTVLYYRHALELSDIFSHNQDLKNKANNFIQKIMPSVESLLTNRETVMGKDTVRESIEMIDVIKETASPALQEDLGRLRKNIQSGAIFTTFKMKIKK